MKVVSLNYHWNWRLRNEMATSHAQNEDKHDTKSQIRYWCWNTLHPGHQNVWRDQPPKSI